MSDGLGRTVQKMTELSGPDSDRKNSGLLTGRISDARTIGLNRRLLWLGLFTAISCAIYLLLVCGSDIQSTKPRPAVGGRNVSVRTTATQVRLRSYHKFQSTQVPTTTATVHSTTKLPNITAKPKVLNPTVAGNSFFYIQEPRASYNVCDRIELYIEARDGQNKTKTRGGDHMWPFLRTEALEASAPADELVDHGNGTYTARFTLHWAGKIQPYVRFVFSAEGADFQRSIRERAPDRLAYDGKFTDSKHVEVTPCHINPNIYVPGLPAKSTPEVCDFSDRKAGTTWYCIKPKNLSCSNFVQHVGNLKRGTGYLYTIMHPSEPRVVKSPKMLRNRGEVRIIQAISEANDSACLDLPPCNLGLPVKQPNYAAGYYFKDSWKSKVCRARELPLTLTLNCLRNKSLYFYGDSTIRQWFEYLVRNLGANMKEEPINATAAAKVGPRRGRDAAHNITLFYRHHEYPIRNGWTNVTDIKFTVNEIDALAGGRDTVVALTMWAHFTPTNLTYYRSRLEHVRDAIARLQRRGEGPSPVFFKSANTRASISLQTSDLYAYDLDQTMRAVFAGFTDVTIIDVWDMTLSHRTGYRIHPVNAVIREEIKMFLNFVCKDAKCKCGNDSRHFHMAI